MRARSAKRAWTNGDAPASDAVRPERPGIDLGPLDQRIGYLLRRAQVAVFQHFFATFEELEIRPAQYSILTVIERNPGLSQSRVAEALGIKKANLVAVIDALEERGLVRRDPTRNDRRAYALSLTPAGQALTRKLHRMSAQHEGRIIDRVGADSYAALFEPLRAIAAMGSEGEAE
jgi:DNA-binding MarR family transcriptional regulator